jgi:hypothetical protein
LYLNCVHNLVIADKVKPINTKLKAYGTASTNAFSFVSLDSSFAGVEFFNFAAFSANAGSSALVGNFTFPSAVFLRISGNLFFFSNIFVNPFSNSSPPNIV